MAVHTRNNQLKQYTHLNALKFLVKQQKVLFQTLHILLFKPVIT